MTPNQMNGWDWGNIQTGADNITSILGTGLDLFGSFKDTFGKSPSTTQYTNTGQGQQTPQPIYIQTPQPTPQQAGFGLDNKTILTIGGLVVAGMLVKTYMENNNKATYIER